LDFEENESPTSGLNQKFGNSKGSWKKNSWFER
jgi:hypothetical protein